MVQLSSIVMFKGKKTARPLDIVEATPTARKLITESSEMMQRIAVPFLVFDADKTRELTRRVKSRIEEILSL